MSLTKNDREIIEKSGFKVHKYADGYVEIEKKNHIYCYDAQEETAIKGLSEYRYDPLIAKLIEKLKEKK